MKLTTMTLLLLAVNGCMTPRWLTEGGDEASDAGRIDRRDDDTSDGYGDLSRYHFELSDIYTTGVNGHLVLGARHSVHGANRAEFFSATARFFEVIRETDPSTYLQTIDELEDINDCGLQILNGDSIDYEQIRWRDVGDMAVLSGDRAVDLERFEGGIISYEADLLDEGLAPQYGAEYRFTGGVSPIRLSVILPEDISFTVDPPRDLSTPVVGDIILSWPRTDSDAVVKIVYSAARYTTADGGYTVSPPFYEITCIAADDGHFAVPASLLSLIPDNLQAELSLRRANAAFVDLPNDEVVFIVAGTSYGERYGPG